MEKDLNSNIEIHKSNSEVKKIKDSFTFKF